MITHRPCVDDEGKLNFFIEKISEQGDIIHFLFPVSQRHDHFMLTVSHIHHPLSAHRLPKGTVSIQLLIPFINSAAA
jgi:hypothetical protein